MKQLRQIRDEDRVDGASINSPEHITALLDFPDNHQDHSISKCLNHSYGRSKINYNPDFFRAG